MDAVKLAGLLPGGFLFLAGLGCTGSGGGGDPFTSDSASTTVTATATATASGTDSDTSSGSDSASGSTSDSGTTGDSGSDSQGTGQTDGASDTDSDGTSGGSGGIKFDLGDAADLPGNTTGGSGDGCKYLDLLFVVDISGSMSEEKANLAANFPNFVQVLDDYIADPNSGAIGYRLGVTNSSHQSDGSTTGLDGELTAVGMGGDCGTGGIPWLDGPDPNIAQNFTCLAQDPKACQGSCIDLGMERPLDTMMLFADKNAVGQPNEGFYRGDESLLVIVTLTDEDDHSEPTLPAETKAHLDAFAQGPDRYVIVTIAGPENMGCMSAFGDADATPRLSSFTNMVSNGTKGDICLGDLSQPLADALDVIQFACDSLPPPQ